MKLFGRQLTINKPVWVLNAVLLGLVLLVYVSLWGYERFVVEQESTNSPATPLNALESESLILDSDDLDGGHDHIFDPTTDDNLELELDSRLEAERISHGLVAWQPADTKKHIGLRHQANYTNLMYYV